jgi:hypothetical protein
LSELALDTPTDDWTALKIEDGDINGLTSRFLFNASYLELSIYAVCFDLYPYFPVYDEPRVIPQTVPYYPDIPTFETAKIGTTTPPSSSCLGR